MELEARGIQEQLERLLANPLFSHSKRYPALLRHVVEKTIAGEPGLLKERNLGVDVFGRDGDYDTNADPVVRTTAAEIRKRIAQYYHEPGHEHEMRIELPSGSYVPEFHLPPQNSYSSAGIPVAAIRPGRHTRARAVLWLSAAAVMATAVILLGTRLLKPDRAIDRFWEPVVSSPSSVLLCVGQRRFLATRQETPEDANPDLARVAATAADPHTPVSLFELYFLGSQNVALPDVVALTGITGWLQAHGKVCHVRGKSSTTLEDLRSGPVILVGAFNNDWTIRLTGELRFWFERDGDRFAIKDRQKPGSQVRSVSYSIPNLKLTEDYALITRVWDSTTERLVVVVAGLTGYGTMAASEFLTQADYLEPLAEQIPRGRKRSNLQIVLATKVIGGHSGPPRIVDSYVW